MFVHNDTNNVMLDRSMRYLPAILSGIMLTASFPDLNLPWLAWIALVPLLVSIKEMKGADAFKAGFVAGFVHYVSLLYWIVPTISIYGKLSMGLTIPILFLLSCYLALYPAIFTWLCHKILHRNKGSWSNAKPPPPEHENKIYFHEKKISYSQKNPHWDRWLFPLLGAIVWVALEYLRSTLFTGFPWGLLGCSQYRFLSLIQIADITSVYGISFLIVLTNGVLALWAYRLLKQREMTDPDAVVNQNFFTAGDADADAVVGNDNDNGGDGEDQGISMGSCVIWSLVLSAVFGMVLTYGCERMEDIEALSQTSEAVSVAVIQGNIEQDVKWEPAYQKATIDKYCHLSMAAVQQVRKPDLVVWPETALPFYYRWNMALSEQVNGCIGRADTTFLVGSPAFERREPPKEYTLYNRAYMINPAGFVTGQYDKIHLVPFGEYVPLGKYLFFLGKLIAQSGDFSHGPSGVQPLAFNGSSAGLLICFEIIFPYLSRDMTRNGAEILVNTTNDAWFGRTAAPWQHFSMAVFRAIENRRAVARAANTGISGFVLPTGNIAGMTKLFEDGHLTQTLPAMTVKTWYTNWGDLFAHGCLVLSLAMTIAMVWPYVISIFHKKAVTSTKQTKSQNRG